MRYRALQEGLLVQEVVPGMGAEQAGVQPGDLVVAVEGQDVDDTAAVRARIMGEPGSFVRLEIEASWAGGTREIDVERGLPAGRSDRVGLAPEVERLRQSVIHERPARAARVMRSLVEQDPESWRSSVLRLLVRAASRTPEVVAAAAAVMVAADPDDLDALYLLGRSRAVQGDPIGTVEALSLVEAQRIPDVQGPDWKGDIGGMANLRSVLAMALWESGLSEEAIDMARQLLRSQDDPELAAALGLEQAGPSTFWNVSLAPAAPLQVQLLDGSSWSLADRDGVVLLAFWATWCEPCREELPELAKLWERHRGGGLEVLAVSLDDAGERADVERFARKLDLPFSVTHAPGLAGRFEVGGIPAVRLLGRSGHVQYRGQGYSPEGMQELETRVEQVLASPVDTPGTVLGLAWKSGQAHL
jgi:thiol-disulfide isomerase/thioredoxin